MSESSSAQTARAEGLGGDIFFRNNWQISVIEWIQLSSLVTYSTKPLQCSTKRPVIFFHWGRLFLTQIGEAQYHRGEKLLLKKTKRCENLKSNLWNIICHTMNNWTQVWYMRLPSTLRVGPIRWMSPYHI